MSAAWYAVADHVGSINDLIGQEIKIELVRMLTDEWRRIADVDATMNVQANGRAWCRVFPTGSQVPTRGGIMRIVNFTDPGDPPFGVMLSADEMLERVKTQLDFITAAYGIVERERDHLRGEAQRWRERAADCDGVAECMGCEP
jgi:hypothetical protein